MPGLTGHLSFNRTPVKPGMTTRKSGDEGKGKPGMTDRKVGDDRASAQEQKVPFGEK